MGSEPRSFDEFWAAFTRDQTSFRLGRAGLSLARLALRRRGRDGWRWALAAAVLTAGKVLAGTFDEELASRARAAQRAWQDDPRALAKGERQQPARDTRDARDTTAPHVDAAWAAWM